jgi:hypothetical protein
MRRLHAICGQEQPHMFVSKRHISVVAFKSHYALILKKTVFVMTNLNNRGYVTIYVVEDKQLKIK